MPAPLLQRWTELHTGAALLASAGVAAGTALPSLTDPGRLVGTGLALLAILAGLLTDGFLGLGAGVLAAAGTVLAVRRSDAWGPDRLGAVLLAVLCLVLLGWVAGLLGASLRAQRRALDRGRPTDVHPALDSLGLLAPDLATLRVEEELARARRHARPLSVLALRVTARPGPDGRAPDEETLRAARRAVTRLLEHRLRRSDAPLALDDSGDLAALLPETDVVGMWTLAALLLDEARRLGVRDRAAERTVPLESVARVQCSLVELAPHHTDAADLLGEARQGLAAEVSAQPAPADPEPVR